MTATMSLMQADPLERASLTALTTLTPRETETLGNIAQGLTTREIATLMTVTEKTVEKHTENLMRKVGVHNRVLLARYAFRQGLSNPSSW